MPVKPEEKDFDNPDIYQKRLANYQLKIKNYNRRVDVERLVNPKKKDGNVSVNLLG